MHVVCRRVVYGPFRFSADLASILRPADWSQSQKLGTFSILGGEGIQMELVALECNAPKNELFSLVTHG